MTGWEALDWGLRVLWLAVGWIFYRVNLDDGDIGVGWSSPQREVACWAVAFTWPLLTLIRLLQSSLSWLILWAIRFNAARVERGRHGRE